MRALAALVALASARAVCRRSERYTSARFFDHRSVGLGDPFRYTVEARGDSTLKVIADTGPFAVVAAPKISRSHSGGQTVVRIEQTLACLDRGCAPGAEPRGVLLPAARAVDRSGTVTAPVAALTLVPRVPASAVAASRGGLPAPGRGRAGFDTGLARPRRRVARDRRCRCCLRWHRCSPGRPATTCCAAGAGPDRRWARARASPAPRVGRPAGARSPACRRLRGPRRRCARRGAGCG